MQIAGLTEEHFALLRFNLQSSNNMTSFERATCLGKVWAFNLYDLRPDVRNSFLSQMVGSSNIKSSCVDYSLSPFWQFEKDAEFSIGIFESGFKKSDSLVESKTCNPHAEGWNSPTYWVMRSDEGKGKGFHYQEKLEMEKGEVYHDKSCKGKICYSSAQTNIKKVWESFSSKPGKKIFIIRDGSYLDALERKDIAGAREALSEIEKINSHFYQLLKNKPNALVLVTSAKVRNFEFPLEGKEWAEFEKSGKNIFFRNSSLLSPVFASGASSENFCGIYNENEIGRRIFWTPRRKKFDIFNL